MKLLSYILLIIAVFSFMGCNEKEEEIGTLPSQDTAAFVTREEDGYFNTMKINPLLPEYKVKKAKEIEEAKAKLKVIDIKIGEGETVKEGDIITVAYTGKLDNGNIFDSTTKWDPVYKKNRLEPFTFTLGTGSVIKGWDLGLADMKVGGKRHLDIPAKLAYGDDEQYKIPANSDLHFDIELLSIDTDDAEEEEYY